MTVVTGPPPGGPGEASSESTAFAAAERPSRADGVELLGAMPGSGYRRAPALVRRRDGQVLQLTPLLYQVLEEIDGERTPAQIGDSVSERVGRHLDAAGVEALVGQLRTLGILRLADGTEP